LVKTLIFILKANLKLNEYITVNYDTLYQAAKNITKGGLLTDDLFQHCIEVLLVDKDGEKIQSLIDKNQLHYYFTAILIRNYHSSTSRFHYIYRKGSDMISDKDVYQVDIPEEEFDALKEAKISFIEGEIQKLDWYSREMVKLYFYEGLSFRKISELTNIPKTSCWNTIQDIKNKLIDKLEDGGSKI
jgi:RNA polymerase sigma factor (sigma-70 family)